MEIVPEVDLLFRDLVGEECDRRHIKDPLFAEYLSALLARFVRKGKLPAIFHPQLYRYSRGPTRHLQKIHFIGDSALFTAGVFSPFTSNTMRDIRYYIAVAQCAFGFLLWNTKGGDKFRELYKSFAADIRPPVDILMQVSAGSLFKQLPFPKEAELYAKFVLSGDPKERERFIEMLAKGFTNL